MSDDLYIWVSGWERFQHYKPERDRVPAWIKDYTKQLDDERYLDLTDRQRALVRDLRDMFAIAHGRIRRDARKIARRRNAHTRDADLAALNHAGLIEFVSRPTLEQRLETLYSNSSPHARPQARGEGESGYAAQEEEKDIPLTPAEPGDRLSLRDDNTNPRSTGTNPRAKGTNPRAKKKAGQDAGLRAFVQRVRHEYTTFQIQDELIRSYKLNSEKARLLVEEELAKPISNGNGDNDHDDEPTAAAPPAADDYGPPELVRKERAA